jgi:hypothetical protein
MATHSSMSTKMKLLFVSYYSQRINFGHLAVDSFRSLQTNQALRFLIAFLPFHLLLVYYFRSPSSCLVTN